MRMQEIEMLIGDTVHQMGFELWGTEYLPQGKHSVLRVFIDSEKGINVEDCADVSRQVSAILDVEDPIKSEYVLEVSSPGMDRPLFKPEQYKHYCGDSIAILLRTPIEGARKLKGTLLAVEDNHILLEVNETQAQQEVAFDNIQKAQVVPEF